MTGTSTSATIAGTARAASSVFTVTRTSSLPAACSARTCAAVAAASAVSVLVIDWTTIGWALPTGTPPTLTVTVGRRVLTEPNISPSRSAPPREHAAVRFREEQIEADVSTTARAYERRRRGGSDRIDGRFPESGGQKELPRHGRVRLGYSAQHAERLHRIARREEAQHVDVEDDATLPTGGDEHQESGCQSLHVSPLNRSKSPWPL